MAVRLRRELALSGLFLLAAAACGGGGTSDSAPVLATVTPTTAPLTQSGAPGDGLVDGDDPAATVASPATSEPARTSLGRAPATEQAPPAHGLRRNGTASDPLRVGLMGDSVALTMRESLEFALDGEELSAVGPYEIAVGGFLGLGFTTDSVGLHEGGRIDAIFEDWRDQWQGWLDENDPDVVVLMQGTWDGIPRLVGETWLEPGSADWQDWYSGRVDEFVDALVARGIRLTWVAQPCIERAISLESVNETVAARSIERGDFGYVNLADELCVDGLPRDIMMTETGDAVSVWQEDGVHFRFDAAPPALGPLLAGALSEDWGV